MSSATAVIYFRAGQETDQARSEGFIDFVRAHTPVLMHSAYVLTGSGPAAEELLQDTLVRLYPRWGMVQDADVPLAYVRRTLTNQFLNQRRRTTNRELVTDTVPDRPVERSTENDVVNRDEMLALLQTLNRRQRTVLVLRYYEGLSDAEIAEALGSRPGTVRSQMSRSLTALREAARTAAQHDHGRPRRNPDHPPITPRPEMELP